MTKLSQHKVEEEKLSELVGNLWLAFAHLDTKADIGLLFRDMFTHTEYKMFAKRLEIARMLLEGESYQNIKRALKVTSNTISRINNVLNDAGSGYRKAANKLNKLTK